MNIGRPSEKKMAMGWSFSLGTIVGTLVTLGLFASAGIHRSTADASPQSRPITGRPAESAGASAIAGLAAEGESHSVGGSAPAPVPDNDSNFPDLLGTVPGHPELNLQLD